MAESNTLEREYVVPLRREFLKVPQYRRAGRAAKALKQFIARHMKVADRNLDNVKLDVYLNNELWMRGKTNPPSKIKVKARKEGDVVIVSLAELPQRVTFLKAKHEKRHKVAEQPKAEAKTETKAEEKSAEEKKDEKEKEKSVAEANAKTAKQDNKAEKHTTKAEKAQRPQKTNPKK